MIAPTQISGPSVLERTTQAGRQQQRTPLSCGTPATPAAARLSALASTDEPITDHVLLVLLGHFAQHLGLVTRLQAVPVQQKTVDHTPQTKLIEFLVAILAGVQQLQELNDAPSPLVADPTVAHAWGLPAFAHYSGVSRTLAAADADTLQILLDALAEVSRPFIERELLALLQTGQSLTIDIDLTGRPVSPTSTDYPEASFGWMDDAVAKGYQSVVSSLSGGPSGRLLLTSQRYTGKVKSAECLQAAVRTLETSLGLYPRRRTELVMAHLDALASRLAEQHRHLEQAGEAQATALWKYERRFERVRPDKRVEQHQARLERRLERTSARRTRLAEQVAALEQEYAELSNWLAQLRADNRALPNPTTVMVRLDAGFSTDANLAWLIEMGYEVLTKAHSGHTTKRLQRAIAAEANWERVGGNAEAYALGAQRIGEGRYELETLQVRYLLPEGQRLTTLLWYGDRQVPAPREWFGQYNGRQTIEAGIKENKAVFTMRRPLVRSPYGMQIQEAFASFGANFVRWAAAWLRAQQHDLPAGLAQALSEVKTLVRVVAHCRARLVRSEAGSALVFDAHSAFAGAALVIRGHPVYQTVLPLFTIDTTRPRELT